MTMYRDMDKFEPLTLNRDELAGYSLYEKSCTLIARLLVAGHRAHSVIVNPVDWLSWMALFQGHIPTMSRDTEAGSFEVVKLITPVGSLPLIADPKIAIGKVHIEDVNHDIIGTF